VRRDGGAGWHQRAGQNGGQAKNPLMEEENKLGGHSKAFNNLVFAALVGASILAASVGAAIEACISSAKPAVERCQESNEPLLLHGCQSSTAHPGQLHPRGWVVGVLVASYLMLVAAVGSTLFSFNMFLRAHIDLLGDVAYNLTREPKTESTLSVISLLFRTGGNVAALLVILYAMVIPALKVILLIAGEAWRKSESERLRQVSSVCIALVQVGSKWATPDLFAYILLLFLFRHLNHPPLVQAEGVLDVGFCSFGTFCICSTLSTLAIHRPPPIGAGPGTTSPACGQPARKPALLRRLGGAGAGLVIAVLEVGFAALLVAGILTPCMGLHLNADVLLEPQGPVPRSMGWLLEETIDKLGLRPLLRAEVSLWNCLVALWGYMSEGEAASVMAFTMVAGLALLLTVADMLMLALATLHLGRTGPNKAMEVSRLLKHITMLDVFCMGVLVVCLAGEAYRSEGFNLGLRRGLLPLVGAEVLHYAAYRLVSDAAGDAEEEGAGTVCADPVDGWLRVD